MKRFIVIALSLFVIGSASAGANRTNVSLDHGQRTNEKARTVAFAAVGVGLLAMAIGFHMSEHNSGQVQIARF
ncbi:hypothetical protein FACS189421_11920 [Bacteroidia bacterium]|nr:hypothetical protein FACS189421_11920 [Bacteroidia bacterium]